MAVVRKPKTKVSSVRRRAPSSRKTARKLTPKKTKVVRSPAGKPAPKTFSRSEVKVIGAVIHYFPKVRVAVVNLKGPVAVGERIKIKGHTTDFTQNVTSLQIDHVALKKAKKGDSVGLLVESRVRRHDLVSRA